MNGLVNGVASAVLDAHDRGLHYGDGVFETLAVADGRARYFQRHMRRLELGCRRLGFPAPGRRVVEAEIGRLCESSKRSVVKLIVTRGTGERGYAPPAQPRPSRVLLRYPWPAYDEAEAQAGVAVRCCTTRLGLNEALAGIKHLNRLEQVLARSEWTDPDTREGLMFDSDGFVIEGVHSNVFLVSGGRLRTPRLDRCGVAGIVRERVLEIAAKEGLDTECCRLLHGDLVGADEIFLTSTVTGIVPVARVDARQFTVGEITLRLRGLLAEDTGE